MSFGSVGRTQQATSAAAALQRGDYTAAEKLYQARAALTATPSTADLKGLAIAQHAQGKESAALATLQRVKLAQADAPYWALRSSAECRLGQYDAASHSLSQLDPLPTDDATLSGVAECMLLAGSPLQAVAAYQRLHTSGESPRSTYAVGLARAYIQASKAILDRLRKRPDSAPYLAALDEKSQGGTGLVEEALATAGKEVSALTSPLDAAAMQTLIAAPDASSAAIFGVGMILGQRGIQAYQEAASDYPDSVDLLLFRATMLLAGRRDKEAVATYREILAADPDTPGIHFQIGSVLGADGDWLAALEEYQQQAKFTPNDERTQRAIAICLINTSRFEDLYRSLEHPASTPDAPVWLLSDFAVAQEHTGKVLDAIRTLKRIDADTPNDARLHYRLYQLYRTNHQDDEARVELARFKELKSDVPSDASAK